MLSGYGSVRQHKKHNRNMLAGIWTEKMMYRINVIALACALWMSGGVTAGFAQTENTASGGEEKSDSRTDDALSIIALVPQTQPAAPADAEDNATPSLSSGSVDSQQLTSGEASSSDEIGDLISLVDTPAPVSSDEVQIQPDSTADNASSELSVQENIQPQPDADNQPTRLNRIGRRQVSQIGLATIGLSPQPDMPAIINSMIWSETDAEEALFLINAAPPISASAVLRRLSDMVITIAALPPQKSEALVEELVQARLDWLAASGQSDKLSQLTRLLPDTTDASAAPADANHSSAADKWAAYKKWQVDYDLIRRADGSACTEAINNAQESLDGFWHKAKITCHILAGNTMLAGFAAELLMANGEEDDNFFMLVDRLLDQNSQTLNNSSPELDLASLSPLHLILMDAAHEQISLEAFETLPASMIQASSSFRYLATNAALKTSYDSYVRGLVSAQQTQEIWRAVSAAQMPAEAALADVISQTRADRPEFTADGLASAYLWASLANRSTADTDMLIRQSLIAEIQAGRGQSLLPFYAQLMRTRAQTADVAGSLTPDMIADFAVISVLDNPDAPIVEAGAGDMRALAVQKLLSASLDSMIDAATLHDAQAGHLWPLLEVKGARLSTENWFDAIDKSAENTDETTFGQHYVQLPFATLKALEQASQKGAVAETVLLASHLVSDYQLGWISPSDCAVITTALKQIGLHHEADAFADEALKAHLMRQYFTPSHR